MNVEMTAEGILKIYAENELEAYALKKWSEENLDLIMQDDCHVDLMSEKHFQNVIVDWVSRV